MECLIENGLPDLAHYPAELQDNGLYKLKCRNGHENSIILQEQKFEVLFELGVNAIYDGYYRDAVSSFTSALERFQEFFIKVVFKKKNIDNSLFDEAWKKVSNQSERQYGAYLFLHTLVKGAVPPTLPNSKVSFRNDVIHKGKIPNREQAIAYGEEIIKCIGPVLDELKKNDDEAVQEVVMDSIKSKNVNHKHGTRVSTMSICTTISVSLAASEPVQTIEDRLGTIARERNHYSN